MRSLINYWTKLDKTQKSFPLQETKKTGRLKTLKQNRLGNYLKKAVMKYSTFNAI